ncbi:MAG: polysaccharide deacetylase family protein [Clostridia bacterium]
MIFFIKKRNIAMLIFFLFIVILIGISLTSKAIVTSSNNNNWGLSYKEKNTPPIANKPANYLKQYNAYYIGDTSNKEIYLTFDAGYEKGDTTLILDTLKKHNVKATFFLVGNYIKTSKDLVCRMIDENHIVGNHTNTHPDMSKISDINALKKELTDNEKLFYEATGKEMSKFYRPPQGKFSEQNLKHASKLGYTTIFWSLAYVDWLEDKQPTRDEAFAKLIPRVHNGSIILLHNTSKTNSLILDELIIKYKEMGYEFKTLNDLVRNDISDI